MGLQRVTLRLTELRCVSQAESGGSEPFLWTTYFAFGAQQLPFQSGPIGIITPAYDAFRTEFPNNMTAGQVATIPAFISSASFDMDLDAAPKPKLVGCIAVVMEEDSTPHSSIVLGRIAYSKAIEEALNALVTKRIQIGNFDPITDQEIAAIKSAVQSKVTGAIASNQSVWNVFTDQDDVLGFVYKTFSYPVTTPGDAEIKFQYFDFPEIASGSNRFTLSGGLSLGPVPVTPTDRCATQRAAVKAKTDEISSLHRRVSLLQSQMQHATPQQKAAIVAAMTETKAHITQAESQLPVLQAALTACQSLPHHGDADVNRPIVVDPR
ncbi:MAG: hypothetical protein H0W08_00695 [Acidobacteria bacterium]|nr:hypothetical protein [Acidobacteriota bacterium]